MNKIKYAKYNEQGLKLISRTECKQEESYESNINFDYDDHEEFKNNIPSSISFRNNIAYAHNVPIYNKNYYECADFSTNDTYFNNNEFEVLLIRFACKSDLIIDKSDSLRVQFNKNQHRRRKICYKNEAEAAFISGVPDKNYITIFETCFTNNDNEKMNINLKQDTNNDNKKYIIWKNNYGVKKDMKYTLYLLLRLYKKYITFGCINIDEVSPPWYNKSNDSNRIDLTIESPAPMNAPQPLSQRFTQKPLQPTAQINTQINILYKSSTNNSNNSNNNKNGDASPLAPSLEYNNIFNKSGNNSNHQNRNKRSGHSNSSSNGLTASANAAQYLLRSKNILIPLNQRHSSNKYSIINVAPCSSYPKFVTYFNPFASTTKRPQKNIFYPQK